MWYKAIKLKNRYAQVYEQGKANGFVKKVNLPIHLSPQLSDILLKLKNANTPGLIVGGAVRDAMLGANPKDLDVEVYNTNLDDLTNLLNQYGTVDLVGKSFGVLKLRTPDGQDFDFSVPRRDNKTGLGHKDFTVSFDPTITPAEAAARRDFTFNSMAFDPISSELHDYWGGEKDLKNKVMRATSGAFMEDSLRVLRGMQFASRFGFHIESETAKMCQAMAKDYFSLPKERIWEEWKKLLLKGKDFHAVFDYLKQTGWDQFFPEVGDLVGVKQESEWHPEGEVHTHTAHVMKAASDIANRDKLNESQKLLLMVSALCHDFAKPKTTALLEKKGLMRITSHGHEEQGAPMAIDFLQRLGAPKELTQKVAPLVANHLAHIRFKGDSSVSAIRQLAHDIAPANIEELTNLVESDHSGRPPLPPGLPEQAQTMIDMARTEGVNNGMPPKLIEGRDVMPYYNNQGGPQIGEAVQAGHKAWLEGRYNNREQALAWLDNYMRNKVSILKGEHVLPYYNNNGGKHVGDVLNQAWQAQRGNVFNDEIGGQDWLKEHMDNNETHS